MSTAPIITCEQLRKTYRRGTVEAVRGIDVTVEPGELVGVLGPNGAGKSTFVNMVCGLVNPTSGQLSVCGHPARSRSARARVGYLAEQFRFPGWLTAGETLAMHQRLAASNGGAAERSRVLERVGLGAPELARRRVGDYSKGMQQRLGIAQALVGSPALIVLDEPTSALDPAGRRLVRDLLVGLQQDGVAVMLNSHLLGEVERTCNRVMIMNRGEIITEGAPAELTQARGVVVETTVGERQYPSLTREEIPELIRTLVADGMNIVRVEPVRSTLEDAYMEAIDEACEPSQ